MTKNFLRKGWNCKIEENSSLSTNEETNNIYLGDRSWVWIALFNKFFFYISEITRYTMLPKFQKESIESEWGWSLFRLRINEYHL